MLHLKNIMPSLRWGCRIACRKCSARISLPMAFCVVVTSVTGFAAVTPAFATEEPLQVGREKDWRVDCQANTQVCVVSSITMASDRTWLTTLRLQPEGNGALGQMLLPPNIHLASGVFVQTGDMVKRAELQRCTPKACLGALSFDERELNKLRRARDLQITYRPSPEMSPISFRASLMGLTAALKRAAEGAP